MGIGIYTAAKIPARGLLRRRPGRDQLFGEITTSVRGAITDPLLSRFVRFSAHEHTLVAVLHPAGEGLEFSWSPDGTLTAGAKTSTAGPGFHALCVDVLDAVA